MTMLLIAFALMSVCTDGCLSLRVLMYGCEFRLLECLGSCPGFIHWHTFLLGSSSLYVRLCVCGNKDGKSLPSASASTGIICSTFAADTMKCLT